MDSRGHYSRPELLSLLSIERQPRTSMNRECTAFATPSEPLGVVMTFAVNVLGWVGVVTLLAAYCVSVVSSRPFDEIGQRLTATIGYPDMNAFHEAIAAATTTADLEGVVNGAIGSSGLMVSARFDVGAILGKERSGLGPQILRLAVGNPLIKRDMAKAVPDAAAYAPVTILSVRDERRSQSPRLLPTD